MSFDTLALTALARELQTIVLHGRVQRVTQLNSLNFGFEIYVHPIRHYLAISIEPQSPHIYLTPKKLRRGQGNETPLMLVLRKYMRGARLKEIRQPPYERLLYLHFENYAGSTILALELLGPRSNLLLLDADQIILGAARLSKSNRKNSHKLATSRTRIHIPGHVYHPPSPQNKVAPHDLTVPLLERELAEASPTFPLARLLPQLLLGLSPQLAREICYQSTGNVNVTVAQVADLAPLVDNCGRYFDRQFPLKIQSTLAFDEDQTPTAFAPYSLDHLGNTKQLETFSEVIELYLAESAIAYTAAKEPLSEAIAEARRKLARRQERLNQDALERSNPTGFKEKGEAILAYSYQIKPGQTKLVVEWHADQPPLEINLDPKLSPSDNAQRYFKRYRKALRTLDEIPIQLDKISLELEYLDQLEQDLDMADDRTEIDTVAAILTQAGYYRSYQPKQPRKNKGRPQKSVSRYLRLTAPDGATVWVGKNAQQNAHLTFNRAKADDLWLHAHKIPGAHVIIPTAQGLPSEADLFWAASVAAYYSKARHDTSVEVDVTLKKYVRAIKGAAPGLVTYRQESTLRVAPTIHNSL
ncbi:NFACT family protein [Anaerolineales bacterium HSG24]|nr:NFACT family protein [Anaerolineales bacterium HSG24]